MKTISAVLLLLVLHVCNALAMTNYVIEVSLPHANKSATLRLDEEGRANKPYDAIIKYPAKYEVTDVARPTEWAERGVGFFIDIAARQGDGDILIDFTLDQAELVEFIEYKISGHSVLQPTFRSINTHSSQLHLWPGQLITLGAGMKDDNGNVMDITLRLVRATSR